MNVARAGGRRKEGRKGGGDKGEGGGEEEKRKANRRDRLPQAGRHTQTHKQTSRHIDRSIETEAGIWGQVSKKCSELQK